MRDGEIYWIFEILLWHEIFQIGNYLLIFWVVISIFGLCCEINYGEWRVVVGVEEGSWNLFFCFKLREVKQSQKAGQSLRIIIGFGGSEIETSDVVNFFFVNFFSVVERFCEDILYFSSNFKQGKKLSPINVSSFDELINYVVAWEFRLTIKILHLSNVHHNYISQQTYTKYLDERSLYFLLFWAMKRDKKKIRNKDFKSQRDVESRGEWEMKIYSFLLNLWIG